MTSAYGTIPPDLRLYLDDFGLHFLNQLRGILNDRCLIDTFETVVIRTTSFEILHEMIAYHKCFPIWKTLLRLG